MKINILGTEYKLIYKRPDEDPRFCSGDGYTDASIKELVVDDMSAHKDEVDAQADLLAYRDQVVRHEIIHAFLAESGLGVCSDWATNEELVDWIAIQLPKITKACEKANCL